MARHELHLKLTLRLYSDDDQRCFGPGIATLLERVVVHRSLRAAAASMGHGLLQGLAHYPHSRGGLWLQAAFIHRWWKPWRRRQADAGGPAAAGCLPILRLRGPRLCPGAVPGPFRRTSGCFSASLERQSFTPTHQNPLLHGKWRRGFLIAITPAL